MYTLIIAIDRPSLRAALQSTTADSSRVGVARRAGRAGSLYLPTYSRPRKREGKTGGIVSIHRHHPRGEVKRGGEAIAIRERGAST